MRPQALVDFIGQEKIKKILELSIQAFQNTGKPVPHICFWGEPGLGKTTLGSIIANEINAKFVHTTGSSLKEDLDLGKLLANADHGYAVLFIDEIHSLSGYMEEKLYTVMEDNKVELNIVGEPTWYKLGKLTIIGATTKLGYLSKPLLDRFGLLLEVEPYQPDELALVCYSGFLKNNIKINPKICLDIALRARGVPRVALRLTSRCIDFTKAKNLDEFTDEHLNDLMEMLEIDENGLEKKDYEILKYLYSVNKPVGLTNIASAVGHDKRFIETMVEPFLVRNGYIVRTGRGRQITDRGIEIIEKVLKLDQNTRQLSSVL